MEKQLKSFKEDFVILSASWTLCHEGTSRYRNIRDNIDAMEQVIVYHEMTVNLVADSVNELVISVVNMGNRMPDTKIACDIPKFELITDGEAEKAWISGSK